MKLARLRHSVARERTGGDSLLASPVPLGGQSARQLTYNLISYFPYSANGRGVRCRGGSTAFVEKGCAYFLTSRALVQLLPVETWAKASGPQSLPSPFLSRAELLEKQAKAEEAA